jgi:hypothetical protein
LAEIEEDASSLPRLKEADEEEEMLHFADNPKTGL